MNIQINDFYLYLPCYQDKKQTRSAAMPHNRVYQGKENKHSEFNVRLSSGLLPASLEHLSDVVGRGGANHSA